MFLDGKTAVITGCNRGIGKSILTVFAENGANIIACARKENADFKAFMQLLAAQNNIEIMPLYFDLTDVEAMKAAAKKIIQEEKKVDILVNNAGTLSSNRLFQMTPISEMKQLFDVNFFSQIQWTQYILRIMLKQKTGGSIINMSSVTALDGNPAQLEYVAGKAAMIGATRKLAREFGSAGIRVNAIAPGLVNTEMGNYMNEELAENMIRKTSLKRKGNSEEIAKTALFFASDLSSYITGQILRVDGGM